MHRAAQSISEKMIKVNHAGENGAVNIYRAQKIGAYMCAKSQLAEISHYQEHEEEHRNIFANHLHEIGVRRCISYHLCGLGGFTLGLVTGFLGGQAIYATTYAVENVVLSHLEGQMAFLKSADYQAYICVEKILEDERQHHDNAKAELLSDHFLTKILIKVVKLSTENVIRFGMR